MSTTGTLAYSVVATLTRHYRIEVTHGRAPFILCRPVEPTTGVALAWDGSEPMCFTSQRQAREWMRDNRPNYSEVD